MKTALWLLIILIMPSLLLAQPQQSEHFRLTKSVLDAGGGASGSANFQLVSAFGQPSPLGVQSSTHFSLSGGFLSPAVQMSPLSPIQALVIQQLNPDVRLVWQQVSGAASYKIYRDTNPLFTPGPANYLGTTSDTAYTDANVVGSPALRNYYTVTALNSGGALLAMPPQQRYEPQNVTKAITKQPETPERPGLITKQ